MAKKNKYDVYFASPIVGVGETNQGKIDKIKEKLGSKFDYYDPSKMHIPNAYWMSMNEWSRCVFTVDVLAMDDCKFLLVCDFGRHGTAGTGWECGYAFAKGKSIVVIRMADENDYSLMLMGSAMKTYTYDEFLELSDDELLNLFKYDDRYSHPDIVYN